MAKSKIKGDLEFLKDEISHEQLKNATPAPDWYRPITDESC